MVQRKRGIFSLTYMFASFFGAAMVAGAFAYFNYKFSKYNFVDFKQLVFYEKQDIFSPKKDEYLVIVFSSNMTSLDKIKTLHKDIPILAVDMYQDRFIGDENVTFISAGMNTLLKFVQLFNIYEIPSAFFIKQDKNMIYKQDSAIQVIK